MTLPRWWVRSTRGVEDYTRGAEAAPDPRRYVYSTIDSARLQKWVVFVAGIGFLTDAYEVFALNSVLPILAFVYWDQNGQLPHGINAALVCSTLAGAAVGQVLFGFLADLKGRRTTYGYELLAVIVATVSLTMCSEGEQYSMSIAGWLIFWRFTLGLGIGADYPLSSAITAEFAPRKHRGRMLALVFCMQPFGQLLGNLVSLGVLDGLRPQYVGSGYDPAKVTVYGWNCGSTNNPEQCLRVLDRSWRLIVGLGTVPAILAIIFRFTIPRSPRYLLDVSGMPHAAVADTREYYQDSTNSLVQFENISLEDQATPSESTPADSQNHKTAEIDETADTSTFGPTVFPQSLDDAHDYFIRQGNVKTLLGTALSWFCLDVPFYGLGLSSWPISAVVWWGFDTLPQPQLDILYKGPQRLLCLQSIGAVIGALVMVKAVGGHASVYSIQLYGFLVLTLLLIVTGGLLHAETGRAPIVLYVLLQGFFNFGPNATTYMLSTELFPTRYRCTCHGLSAAAGRLGAIVAQGFVAYVKWDRSSFQKLPTCSGWDQSLARFDGNGTSPCFVFPPRARFGNTLMVLSAFTAAGSAVTWTLIPRNIQDGQRRSRTLETLAKGRAELKRLGKEEERDEDEDH